ncbi:putative sugar transporter-like protein [Phaeoacremonium minimum UCRPA7]|uniref:Putative sugar transporter-like protein n=1 Tax=Phaeoacremonium minimum (strain UCR-PA7) TaxID=1286976 RepID=R8BHY3_PHAM7|nr:putative sugar transporter-like protein [Phaeoacremonium minimum UCRPA7]EON98847.1 putative sugar transporter-like protein [Phaeoacremonium minimum UCRPA7]
MGLPTLPKIYNVHFVAIIATLGGALFGFDISSMSAIVVTNQYINYFNNPSGVIQGAIGSALAAGSVVGSAVAGPISDKIGRRDSIMFACIFWLIGTSVQVACRNYGELIAGRVLNGFTVGITSSQVPVYLAEIAKKDKRGSIVIIQQLAIEFGILIMYFIGYGCSKIDGTASFRTAWGTQFIPAVFLILGLPFLPRSPRWLAKVGREKEAIQTLARIQAGGNENDPLVIAEWEEIVTTMRAEQEAGRGWRKFFKNGMWKRTMAGMTVQAWQQLAGANIIVYYLTYIAEMAGLSGDVGMVTSGIQYAVFIIFTGIMWIFIDKTGRRTLLVWGALGMGFCHFVIGGVMGAHHTNVPGGVGDPPNANIVIAVDKGAPANTVIVFSYLLIVVYALTLAPVCWIYAAEVWSLGTRATGMSMAAMSNWVFNFALGMFTPPAFVNITWKLFIIFGVLCIAAAGWFFIFYPETCGKTLEEVELMFSKEGPHPWKTRKGESRLEAEIEAVVARKTQDDPPVDTREGQAEKA